MDLSSIIAESPTPDTGGPTGEQGQSRRLEPRFAFLATAYYYPGELPLEDEWSTIVRDQWTMVLGKQLPSSFVRAEQEAQAEEQPHSSIGIGEIVADLVKMGREHLRAPGGSASTTAQPRGDAIVPCWDSNHYELSFGGTTWVKYERVAENQQRILEAFQNNNWKETIDSPLADHTTNYTLSDLREKLEGTPIDIRKNGKGRLRWSVREQE
jgi:hypothetical protein